MAPALRAGWLAASTDLIEMLKLVKEAADIHADRVNQRLVYNAATDFLDGHIARVRPIYRRRRDAMLAALAEQMPAEVRWSRPGGGFFVWVTLPESVDAEAMLPHAVEHGVAYLPGSWFFPSRDVGNVLRLNYSTLAEEPIREGVRRLARAVAAGMDHRSR
jgi:DNA-binding transcriptional MocR family regulator